MTDDQQTVTDLFGWTSVVVIAIICLWFIWLIILRISEFFTSSYEVNNIITYFICIHFFRFLIHAHHVTPLLFLCIGMWT